MPIGTVIGVDPVGRSCSVQFQDASGVRTINNVSIEDAIPGGSAFPKEGDFIRIEEEAGEWFTKSYPREDTEEARSAAEDAQLMPGDQILGSPDDVMVGKFAGGVAGMMAGADTGVMVSKTSKSAEIFGNNIREMTPGYMRTVETNLGDSTVHETLSRAIDGATVLESTLKTSDTIPGRGSLELNLAHLDHVRVQVNVGNLLLPVEGGTLLELVFQSLAATPTILQIDPVTGAVSVIAPQIKLVAPITMVDPTGVGIPIPSQGVVTGETICPFTRLPHVGVSNSMFVKGAL